MHVYVALLRRNLVCRKKKEKAQRINCKSVSHKCYPNAAVLQFAVINSFALSFVDILLCTLYHSHWDISSSYPTPPFPFLPRPMQKQSITMVFPSWRRRHTAFCRWAREKFSVNTLRYDTAMNFTCARNFNRKLLPASRECVWLDDFLYAEILTKRKTQKKNASSACSQRYRLVSWKLCCFRIHFKRENYMHAAHGKLYSLLRHTCVLLELCTAL